MNKSKLNDLVEIYNGSTPSTSKLEYFDGEIPWITPKDLSDKKTKYISSGERNITELGLASIGNRLLPEGTILFSSRAPIGLMSISSNIVSTNQGFKNLVCKEDKINNEYLFYLLKTKINEIQELGTGTTFKEVSKSTLGEFEFYYETDITVQQKIARVLSDLDAKIELNNKVNSELEAMAKTLYEYWFVQFDFPNVHGKPYKSSGGTMVWNKELKREIPKGWEVKSIDEYAEVKKGELITAKDSEVGEIKVVAAGISYSYKHSKANREKNTITISGSGANAGFINFWREQIFASDCITVRGNTDTETLMLLQYLKFIQAHILKQATGSAQPHVYPSDIKVLNYTIPPKELIVEFGKIIIPMNNKIAVNQKENEELASLRDWLLPMLMNGQVSVGGYEIEDSELGMVAEDKVEYKKS